MRVLYLGRIGNWRFWCLWKEENRRTRRKPGEQGDNPQQTQPTYGTGPVWNLGNIDGKRALSPLRQFCSPKFKLALTMMY